MHQKELISIVVTTHLRPDLLERALNSILNQTISVYEIVLCSDYGDRATKQIATKLLRENDLFLCVPGMRGPAESRNLGIKMARGEWICFLDDDDSFEIDFFEKIIPYLSDSKKIYYTNYSRIKENRIDSIVNINGKEDITHSFINPYSLYIGNFIPNNTFFISKNAASKLEFDERLETHEDWDWLLGLLHNGIVEYVHAPIFGPNVHISGQESRNNNANKGVNTLLDYLSIYRKWPGVNEEIKKIRSDVISNVGLNVPKDFL